MAKKKKKKKAPEKVEDKILAGKCLMCGTPMGKNFKSCRACRKKDRLKRKANKRGLSKNTYLHRLDKKEI